LRIMGKSRPGPAGKGKWRPGPTPSKGKRRPGRTPVV